MSDYEQIRKRYLAGESQRSIAKSLGISRNTVAKYCKGAAVPWERKTPERDSTVLTDEVSAFILSCLEEDQQVSFKKQKHTAKRIYDRLVAEKGFTGGESTIRRKVKELKALIPKAFIPLNFAPGNAMQVDWGEADVYINGIKTRINLFCARLCYSCRPFVMAYHKQNTESFCEAIIRTFTIMNGVTKRIIFDNGRVAVKHGVGSHAKMQDTYAALSAHYGFEAVFCNPGQGHEKGLVEGLVGWARRNMCVPVPKVSSIKDLNELLLQRCYQYEQHTVKSRKSPVGMLYKEEQASLRALPAYTFEIATCIETRVSVYSTVCYKTNKYSVPVKYVNMQVCMKIYPETVRIFHKGTLISSHERLMGRNQNSYHLEDYMPLLEQKPRAVFNAAPVKQNVPAEVLRKLEGKQYPHKKIINILNYYAKKTHNKAIENPVIVQSVDLHQYDALSIGTEVKN